MNQMIARTLAATMVLAPVLGCGAPSDREVETPETGVSAGVLDPNLTSEEELSGLPHLDATLAKGIVDRRPFLSITSLDDFLSGSLGEEETKPSKSWKRR